MIDRETAFVGMKVIRKSDGSQHTIKNIHHSHYCFDLGPSVGWFAESHLDPAEPKKPPDIAPTAETKRIDEDELNEFKVVTGDIMKRLQPDSRVQCNSTRHWIVSCEYRTRHAAEKALETLKAALTESTHAG